MVQSPQCDNMQSCSAQIIKCINRTKIKSINQLVRYNRLRTCTTFSMTRDIKKIEAIASDHAGLLENFDNIIAIQNAGTTADGIRSWCHGQNANVWNATDFYVWGLGLGREFFVLGFWVLAFRHWRFVPRSQPMACFGHRYPCYTLNTHYRSKVLSWVYFWKQKKVYPICNGSEEG